MFTGIIEELGRVKEFKKSPSTTWLTIKAQEILEDIETGASIAVNGTCLTVVDHTKDGFTVEVSPETLKRTTVGSLAPGAACNLERSMKFGSRMGGHLVTGHVDAVGKTVAKTKKGNSIVLRIQFPHKLKGQIVAQGSIAIDGVSLTIVEIVGNSFSVSIVPHTADVTNLGALAPGTAVNLETDLIGKYVKELLVSKGVKAQMISSFESRGGLNGIQSH